MRDWYAAVMDPEKNPLTRLSPVRRLQAMALPGLMPAPASRAPRQPRSYRDQPRRDGTPRYDDVWGG